jgi:argininosuccinate lyase
MIATLRFDVVEMRAAAPAGHALATDIAEWLVRGGTPFREAHAIVGSLVRCHLAGEGTFRELVAADLGPEAAALVGAGIGGRNRTSPGGAGPDAIAARFDADRAMLGAQAGRFHSV